MSTTPCAGCCTDPDCPCVKECDEQFCARHFAEESEAFRREYLSGSDLRTAALRIGVRSEFDRMERECKEAGR